MRLVQIVLYTAIAKALWILKEVSGQGTCSSLGKGSIEGNTIRSIKRISADACCEKCYEEAKCVAYTHYITLVLKLLRCDLKTSRHPLTITGDNKPSSSSGFVTRFTTATTLTSPSVTSTMSTTTQDKLSDGFPEWALIILLVAAVLSSWPC